MRIKELVTNYQMSFLLNEILPTSKIRNRRSIVRRIKLWMLILRLKRLIQTLMPLSICVEVGFGICTYHLTLRFFSRYLRFYFLLLGQKFK